MLVGNTNLASKSGENQVCTNLPGSYLCDCAPGYFMSGSQCVDVNDCRVGLECHFNAKEPAGLNCENHFWKKIMSHKS